MPVSTPTTQQIDDIACPFNVSGFTMPGGLPVGVMLVRRHFEETTLMRPTHAFETDGGWRSN